MPQIEYTPKAFAFYITSGKRLLDRGHPEQALQRFDEAYRVSLQPHKNATVQKLRLARVHRLIGVACCELHETNWFGRAHLKMAYLIATEEINAPKLARIIRYNLKKYPSSRPIE